MAMDLLDLVSKGLGSDFTSRIAGVIGESAQNTQGALDSGLPLLLAGLTRKAASPDGAADVLGLINRHGTDPAQLANLPGLLSGANLGNLTSAGSGILAALFGNNTGGLWNALSGLAGIRPQSGATLMGAAAPLAMGLLRGLINREGMGASGLASLLLGQRESLARKVPESLARSVGWGAPSTWFAADGRHTGTYERPPKSGTRWLPWIIGLLLALLLLMLLPRCGRDVNAPASVSAASVPEKVELYFDTGSTAVDPGASLQLGELAEYAKANPSSRVTVSGYHSPSGDAATNEEVSKNRALAVRDVLMGLGVAESSIVLDKPLVTTGGGEERESRRVEVSVR